jgi:hypothetical protein
MPQPFQLLEIQHRPDQRGNMVSDDRGPSVHRVENQSDRIDCEFRSCTEELAPSPSDHLHCQEPDAGRLRYFLNILEQIAGGGEFTVPGRT